MQERFSDNAVGTLADAIDDVETTITLADEPGAERFYPVEAGGFQRATVYDPSDPEAIEIVHITERVGLVLTVVRGQEDTTPQAWSAGIKIGARVTAQMLGSALRAESDGVYRTPSNTAFVVNGRSALAGTVVQVGGWPVLQMSRAQPSRSADSQDNNLSRECVGGSPPVNLGDVPTWISDEVYPPWSIVAPTTPEGFVYFYEPTQVGASASTTAEPAFDSSGDPVEAYAGGTLVGLWIPVSDDGVVKQSFTGFGGNNLVLSEVGFICMRGGAGSAPVISVGTQAAPTRFVDTEALTQISGAVQIHRFPITAGGALVSDLQFSLDTATTGEYIGRFYWRGFFAEMIPE